MSRRHRIAVVDDHPVIRQGIVETLQEQSDFVVVGEGESADDALILLKQASPDLFVLDANMPGGGINAIIRLRQESPSIRTVMFSYRDDAEIRHQALEVGAADFVLKGEAAARDLTDAIRRALQTDAR